MNINKLVNDYINKGYEIDDAESKVCQDIILLKIGKSKYSKNVTVKGGVVLHALSNDMRRATRDLDLDFIKYSLTDNSIEKFVKNLNKCDDNSIILKIVGKISDLKHQTYVGKRVNICITDNYENTLNTKLDIGVHKYFDMKQEEFVFSFDILEDSVCLSINTKEQIIVEKLKSLLKFGVRSTRYKDLFDFYYLITNEKLDNSKVIKYIDLLIFKDNNMKQNSLKDIVKRLKNILSNNLFIAKLDTARSNWIECPIDEVIDKVIDYFEKLEFISV